MESIQALPLVRIEPVMVVCLHLAVIVEADFPAPLFQHDRAVPLEHLDLKRRICGASVVLRSEVLADGEQGIAGNSLLLRV